MTRITIRSGAILVRAELNDTGTGRAVAAALPIEGRVSRWGEEVYFEIPVEMGLEAGARAEVEIGELGFWPSGNAFCVFFGPTPASQGPKPRAASAVNIIGQAVDDARALADAKNGDKILIARED